MPTNRGIQKSVGDTEGAVCSDNFLLLLAICKLAGKFGEMAIKNSNILYIIKNVVAYNTCGVLRFCFYRHFLKQPYIIWPCLKALLVVNHSTLK